MNSSPGAIASLILAFLVALAWQAPGTSQERIPAFWRTVFVERLPDGFRVGDQSSGSQNCIGWACRGALLGEPVHHAGQGLPSPGSIFVEALRHSERSSTNIGLEHGAMALMEMNAIHDYRILRSSSAIWEWLQKGGPVAAAIYWDELLTAHRGGLRTVPVTEGTSIGRQAHAITILGWSPSRKAFYFTPNLGRKWGRRGFGFIREEDLPLVLINAVGFVHETTDGLPPLERNFDSGTGGPTKVGDPSSAEWRRATLREALSRVDAITRSLPDAEVGATGGRH